MIRLGTVGTSRIADGFLSGAALTGEFVLSAVYSRNFLTGKEFGQKHGCSTVFTDLEKMAESGIDAVYIASPNIFHAEQSKIFLNHGIHVICEKPVVTCAEDYKKLKFLADSKSLIYMEAIIPRHTDWYSKVKEAVRQAGKISLARIDYSQRSSRLDAFLSGEKMNIFDMSLHAGTLMDLGVYCVYGAVDLLGVPENITASATLLPNGCDGAGTAIFEYGDFNAAVTYCKTGQSALGSEIIGQNATVKIRMISTYCEASIIKDGTETVITENTDKAHLMQGEAQKFADYILRFKEYKNDYEKASALCLDVHKCMDKIKKSAGLEYPAKK